jgi:hypothetical protein
VQAARVTVATGATVSLWAGVVTAGAGDGAGVLVVAGVACPELCGVVAGVSGVAGGAVPLSKKARMRGAATSV